MAKLTRKSYQRKAMVVGATAFAGIALVATGFAAWVISSSANKTLDGSVNIGVVSDKSITLNAAISSEEKGFSFEPLKNDVSGRVRWDAAEGKYENLSITVSGDYSPASYVNKFTMELRIGSVEEIDEAKKKSGKTTWETNFENAVAKNYITLPTDVWCVEKVFTASELTDKVGVENTKAFSKNIAFGWGTTFGNVNPSRYYDEITEGKAVKDEVLKTTMKDFYAVMTAGLGEAVHEIPFQVFITADTSGAAVGA